MTQEQFSKAQVIKEEISRIVEIIEEIEKNATEMAFICIDVGERARSLPKDLFSKEEILQRLHGRLSLLSDQFKEL